MAFGNKLWIFCSIFLTELVLTATEGSNETTQSTTTTTTTTESSGTITLPAWIIYALVFPIIGIVVIIGLLALCRWISRKRNGSVVPSVEPENHRIVNELNNENEGDTENFDRFVVSHESKKLSPKPKKAVNCLPQKTPQPVSVQGTHPGIERLNNALELIKEEHEMKEKIFPEDAVSENAFNHLKEERLPKLNAHTTKQDQAITGHSESMKNTFKIKHENESKSQISKAIRVPNRRTRKKRKPKVSALKRNTKLLKSKLNLQTTDSSDEATDDTTEISTSTIGTESEEESEIDPSFAQSGEDDFITDDEDSGRDSYRLRYLKPKKMKKVTSNETPVERISNISTINKRVYRSQSTNIKGTDKPGKSDKMDPRDGYKNEHHSQKKLSRSKSTSVKLETDHSNEDHHVEEITSGAPSKDKPRTIIKSMYASHVPRQGPVATSSFKSTAEDKAAVDKDNGKANEIQTNFNRKESTINDVQPKESRNILNSDGIDGQRNHDGTFLYNYKQFEETVMKRGKVNLNRSVSLNEVDKYQEDMISRRRKRKYQSLRQAKKESVFNVLLKLDTVPKKSILKKSKSLHVKNSMTDKSNLVIRDREEANTRNSQNKDSPDTQPTFKTDVTKLVERKEQRGNHFVQTKTDFCAPETCPVKLEQTRKNTNFQKGRSKTPDPFIDRDKNSKKINKPFAEQDTELNDLTEFKKQRRNKLFEGQTGGSVAVVTPNKNQENGDVVSDTENVKKPEIVSSNLVASAQNFRETSFSFTSAISKPSFTENSFQNKSRSKSPTGSFPLDRFSPILPKDVEYLYEEASKQKDDEGEKSGPHQQRMRKLNRTNTGSFTNSVSEPIVLIDKDIITFNIGQQARLREELIAQQQEHNTPPVPFYQSDCTETQIEEVTSIAEAAPSSVKFNSYERDAVNVNKARHNMDDYRTEVAPVNNRQQEYVNQPHGSSVFVSERGLVFFREHDSSSSENHNFKSSSYSSHQHDEIYKPTVAHSEDMAHFSSGVCNEQGKETFNEVKRNQKDQTPDQKSQNWKTEHTGKDQHPFAMTMSSKPVTYDNGQLKLGPLKQASPKTHPLSLSKTLSTDMSQTKQRTISETNSSDDRIFRINGSYAVSSEVDARQKITHLHPTLFGSAKTPTLTEDSSAMRITPNHASGSQPSLGNITDYKRRASIIDTVSKMAANEKARAMVPYDRPKSADLFSWRQESHGMKIPGSRDVHLRDPNAKLDDHHSKQHNKDKVHTHSYKKESPEILQWRSKTPSLDLERSSKHLQHTRRSKTPTPCLTYTTSYKEDSLLKMQMNDVKPKLQTLSHSKFQHYNAGKTHIESFSRNFQTSHTNKGGREYRDYSRNVYRTSLRDKKASMGTSETTKSNSKPILTRREKETNTLDDRDKLKKPSERERPKSAMSLRSAPRPTYLETVRDLSENQTNEYYWQTRYDSNAQGSGRSFLENNKFPYKSDVKQGDAFGINKRYNLGNHADNVEVTDSDNEIEQFFANPDAEVLRLADSDIADENFVMDCENAFSVYSNRNKLSKSKSFKM